MLACSFCLSFFLSLCAIASVLVEWENIIKRIFSWPASGADLAGKTNFTLTVISQRSRDHRTTARCLLIDNYGDSRSRAPYYIDSYYINAAAEWISRIMTWKEEMTSAEWSVSPFENVSPPSLDASWLHPKPQTAVSATDWVEFSWISSAPHDSRVCLGFRLAALLRSVRSSCSSRQEEMQRCQSSQKHQSSERQQRDKVLKIK